MDITYLIVLVYYNRPEMVLNALHSINEIDYPNFELAFIDDGSTTPGRPIAEQTLKPEILKRTTFFRCDDTETQKREQGGSRHGFFMNQAIINSNADYFIILCDDDALVHDYFTKMTAILTCGEPVRPYYYNWVLFFNPETQHYLQSEPTTKESFSTSTYNINHQQPLMPANHIDGSQMLCSTGPFKNARVAYPFPQTRCLDSALYTQLQNLFGECFPTKLYAQYKAAFSGQMGNRADHETY